jgi:Tol biopolymer transport system component
MIAGRRAALRLVRLGLPLVLALAAGGACQTNSKSPTAGSGILWTRVTPASAAPADRPDWAGDSLAFQTTAAGFQRIAIAREDGSAMVVEPAPPSVNARAPRWVTPTLLVYSSDESGGEDLWYLDVASGATRRLTALPAGEWDPVPRPGGPGLAYVDAADSLGGQLAFLPDTAAAPLAPIPLTPAGLTASEPDFDPAGDFLYFSARGVGGSSHIWKVAVSGADPPVQLTTGGSRDLDPRVSPDGSRVLFVSDRGGRWGIWTVSPMGEGAGLTLITYDSPWAVPRHPAWSPSGLEIIISSDRQGGRALWVLSNLGP